MAQKVTVHLVDDLDGTTGDDVETVTFSLDGVSYEIDLHQRNATRLRDGVAGFVQAARRIGGRVHRGTRSATLRANPATSVRSEADARDIRAWARKTGHTISERGRIPAWVITAYETAHANTTVDGLAAAGRQQ